MLLTVLAEHYGRCHMAYLVRNGRGLENGLVSSIDALVNDVFNGCYTNQLYPPVDIRVNEDAYVLEVEIPGLTKDDVVVTLEDNLLIIESAQEANEEKSDKNSASGGYVRRERRGRAFRRSFAMPKDVDGSKIDAAYRNGMLTLTLPKHPETKPRTIAIKNA
jgi:HSP20 family protein